MSCSAVDDFALVKDGLGDSNRTDASLRFGYDDGRDLRWLAGPPHAEKRRAE